MKISLRKSLKIISIVSFLFSILWFLLQPGFEPLLAFLGSLASFASSLTVPDIFFNLGKEKKDKSNNPQFVSQSEKPLALNGKTSSKIVPIMGWVFLGISICLCSSICFASLGLYSITNLFTKDYPLKTETLEREVGDTQFAYIEINWGLAENYYLGSLPEDSSKLIEAVVNYHEGKIIFDTNATGNSCDVKLGWSGFVSQKANEWTVNLHPKVEYSLKLNSNFSGGNHGYNLSNLVLSKLDIIAGTGYINLALPNGSYHVSIDSKTGRIEIFLPQESAVQIQLKKIGDGVFTPNANLQSVQSDNSGIFVWETSTFGSAPQKIVIEIQQESGEISIKP